MDYGYNYHDGIDYGYHCNYVYYDDVYYDGDDCNYVYYDGVDYNYVYDDVYYIYIYYIYLYLYNYCTLIINI